MSSERYIRAASIIKEFDEKLKCVFCEKIFIGDDGNVFEG